MAATEKPCCTCKRLQPLMSFVHQRFPQRVTAACLDCHSSRQPPPAAAPSPPSLPVASPPLPASTPAPSDDPSTSALSAPPLPAFVTCADLAASLGELQQYLQDKIAHAMQGFLPAAHATPASAPAPAPPPAAAAPSAAIPLAPALPACTGEYQLAISYPWLLANLVDKVLNNTLGIYELLKLANPSWPGMSALEDPAAVVVEGVTITKAPTTSTLNRQFLKAVPSFAAFARLWVVYLTLHTSSSLDQDLPVSLGRFYLHIADLHEVFPWHKVVDYVVAVCTSHLGKATSVEWARFNTELHAAHFQGVAARLPAPSGPSSSTKRPAPCSDDPCRDQICISWNNGKCVGTDQWPCMRKHVCLVCAGSHTLKACTCPAPSSSQPAKVAKTA